MRDPAFAHDDAGELGARADPELPVDAAEVELDGARAQEQRRRGFLVRRTLRDGHRDLQLRRRSARPEPRASVGAVASPAARSSRRARSLQGAAPRWSTSLWARRRRPSASGRRPCRGATPRSRARSARSRTAPSSWHGGRARRGSAPPPHRRWPAGLGSATCTPGRSCDPPRPRPVRSPRPRRPAPSRAPVRIAASTRSLAKRSLLTMPFHPRVSNQFGHGCQSWVYAASARPRPSSSNPRAYTV